MLELKITSENDRYHIYLVNSMMNISIPLEHYKNWGWGFIKEQARFYSEFFGDIPVKFDLPQE